MCHPPLPPFHTEGPPQAPRYLYPSFLAPPSPRRGLPASLARTHSPGRAAVQPSAILPGARSILAAAAPPVESHRLGADRRRVVQQSQGGATRGQHAQEQQEQSQRGPRDSARRAACGPHGPGGVAEGSAPDGDAASQRSGAFFSVVEFKSAPLSSLPASSPGPGAGRAEGRSLGWDGEGFRVRQGPHHVPPCASLLGPLLRPPGVRPLPSSARRPRCAPPAAPGPGPSRP